MCFFFVSFFSSNIVGWEGMGREGEREGVSRVFFCNFFRTFEVCPDSLYFCCSAVNRAF